MSNKELARRTSAQICFAGVNITKDIQPYLLSVQYTDNEEDETDDLQIKLQDTQGIWLEKWLNTAVTAAAGGSTESDTETTEYSVSSANGVNVRAGEGTSFEKLGFLAYGTTVDVYAISRGWARIWYSGKTAYVSADCIEPLKAEVSISNIQVGDTVVVSGRPQYSSYGEGTPGATVTNYSGQVTYLNKREGVPYPIHVGYLGWFAESQISGAGGSGGEPSVGIESKGLRIQASILRQNWNDDGNDDVLECGQFELDSVTAQGPPSIVTIKGTSLAYSSSIRQAKKSKSWEGYTLKGILAEVTGKNGLSYMFSSSRNPVYKRVEQYQMSDIAFLQKLCNDCGAALKCTNNIVVIYDKTTYEQKPAVLMIEHNDGTYLSYNLKTGKNDVYTACTVSYTTSSGSVISATAYIEDYDEEDDDNQTLYINQKVTSQAEAQSLAEYLLKRHNSYEVTATFKMPGNPSLVAGNTVMLNGWGGWDGKYIIAQAKHLVSNAGYTTQIELRSVLAGKKIKKDTEETTTTSSKGGQKVVDVAEQQIGNGYSKYCAYFGMGRFEWCAAFVSWCAYEAGYGTSIVPKTTSCRVAINFYKEAGEWKSRGYEPKPGDQIFFDWDSDGVCDHTGIVSSYSNGTIYTIEGNKTGDIVATRTYSLNSGYIFGFGTPAY